MLKAVKDDRIIYVTEKMFKLLYEAQGYELVQGDNEENVENGNEGLSLTKLRAIAKEKEISGYSKMTKEELLAALDEAESC